MDELREPTPTSGYTAAEPTPGPSAGLTTEAGPTPGPASPRARWPRWAHRTNGARRQGPTEPTATGPTPRPGPRLVVTGPARHHPGPTPPRWAQARPTPTRARRTTIATLAGVSGVLLASIVVAPTAMSSQEIVGWARSAAGLSATGIWPYVAFYALDAAAVFCVLMGVYATWVRGESPGAFRAGVWIFAGFSACAQYAFAQAPGSGASSWWFYPAMSILGPALLEVTLHRVRRWVNEGRGRRARTGVAFPISEWVPVIGHFRETFGAWRLARFLDMTVNPDGTPFTGNLPARARFMYRALCPDGSLRVFGILRDRQAAALDGVEIALPGLVPADVLPAAPRDAPGGFRMEIDILPDPDAGRFPAGWGTDPRDGGPGPNAPVSPAPTRRPDPGSVPADTPPTDQPDDDQDDDHGDHQAAGVEITEDEIGRLLVKHAEHLFAIRDGFGHDKTGADWLTCDPPVSRRLAIRLAGLKEGRPARELHTCLKHLRADRAAVAKIPTKEA